MSGSPQARSPEPESMDLLGGRLELVASIEPPAGDVVVFRTRMEAGSFVPLHSHLDPECFYVLSGSIGAFTDADEKGWRTISAGRSISMENGARHSVRAGTDGAELIVMTNHRLADFFSEARRPAAAGAAGGPPSTDDLARVKDAAGRYGYWLSTPEESARITGR